MNVCVVGVGLIGGSLGLALRHVRRAKGRGRAYHLTGLGRDAKRLKTALRRGAIDVAQTNPRLALASADVVVFCVPVQSIVPLARRFLPFYRKGAILTDVGSVKEPVVKGMKAVLARRRDLMFVGTHPVAGSERTGVENAQRTLFKSAVCVLTRPAPNRALSTVRRLWRDAGARCVDLDARRHDAILALTSHLPHLLSFALFSTVSEAAKKDRHVRDLVAGSFRDMTRVAGSDAELWTGILQLNKCALSQALRRFDASAKRLTRGKGPALRPLLDRLSREKTSWSA